MNNVYSVVDETNTPNIVLSTYPFRWMAAAAVAVRGGEKKGYGVAITTCDPQTIINNHHHFDQLVQRWHGESGRGELVDVLWGMVSRGGDGRWETVHDAETPLPEASQKILDRVLG